jgi:hypothetical protein
MVNRDKVAIVPKPLGVAFGFRLKVDTAEYDHPVLSDNQNFDLFDHFYGNIRHFAILCVYAAYKRAGDDPGIKQNVHGWWQRQSEGLCKLDFPIALLEVCSRSY